MHYAANVGLDTSNNPKNWVLRVPVITFVVIHSPSGLTAGMGVATPGKRRECPLLAQSGRLYANGIS